MRVSVLACLLAGCVGSSRAPGAADPCDSCEAGTACGTDDVCRPVCNSARDCSACDQCGGGVCQPLDDCDGTTTGGAGTPCVASAQCDGSAPICEDVCRGCDGD